jgi:hypothetical protein
MCSLRRLFPYVCHWVSFVSINQRLDAETIAIVADEFGFEVEFVSAEVQEAIPTVEDKEEDLLPRLSNCDGNGSR